MWTTHDGLPKSTTSQHVREPALQALKSEENNVPALLAVDWGTSSLRAFTLDRNGQVISRRQKALGIRSIKSGEFEKTFVENCLPLISDAPETPVLMCGMVGSRLGWKETDYLECPTSLSALSEALQPLQTQIANISIVPGLVYRSRTGTIDVIRGEETQVLGTNLKSKKRKSVCIPGTHSKWCNVESSTITAFTSYLTGELYEILCKNSVISQGIPRDSAHDAAGFQEGLLRADIGGAMLHEIFGVRTAWLFDTFAPESLPSFLSGLLIGTEVKAALAHSNCDIELLAAGQIAENYQTACAFFGIDVEIRQIEHATTAGLWSIAKQGKLVSH